MTDHIRFGETDPSHDLPSSAATGKEHPWVSPDVAAVFEASKVAFSALYRVVEKHGRNLKKVALRQGIYIYINTHT